MKRLLYGTTTAQGNDTTSATNALVVRNSAGNVLLGITNDGSVRIGTNASATTQTTASINASGSGTNIGLALVPKGTGALTAQIPDGTITGGNARGTYAVDLQMQRASSNQVASGDFSFVGGGWRNRASSAYNVACGGNLNTSSGAISFTGGGQLNSATASVSVVVGGDSNSASGAKSCVLGGLSNTASGTESSISGGNSNTASGANSFVGGGHSNTASGESSVIAGGGATGPSAQSVTGRFGAILGGVRNTVSALSASVSGGDSALAYLAGQRANAMGGFSLVRGSGQTSAVTMTRQITGTSATELTLDGSAPAAANLAVLSLPTGITAGRVWNAKIQVVAVCTVQGAGTVTAGEVFGGNYAAIIKRIGTSTSLVGTVQNLHTAQTDTNMATAAVTITADDTNESLKIEFTPPTTAAADTVIRVVATVYLTEVGY